MIAISLSVANILRDAEQAIDRFEAQYLISHLLGVSRASLIAHPERLLTDEQLANVVHNVRLRQQGVPVAYLLGQREFYGRPFKVSPDVLIPRPETEILIEHALTHLLHLPQPLGTASTRILELGTGSGIIAITLKAEAPHCDITATDLSKPALNVAKQNAIALGVDITWLQSDWYSALSDQTFDLIVSNPPYIAVGDPHLKQGDLRFEPAIALTDGVPGANGLACIHHIIDHAPQHLNPGGWLLLEHGYDQFEAVRERLSRLRFTNLMVLNDLAGIPRVSGGQWPAACRA